MPGQKKRFDVFKRDGFKCQYCGAGPPKVVLQVDHIEPRSLGGDDDLDNLITACRECNIGKGAKRLKESIPEAIEVRLAEIQERELQIAEFRKWKRVAAKRISRDANRVGRYWTSLSNGSEMTPHFKKTSVRLFLKHLEPEQLEEFLATSHRKFPGNDERAMKYFCGCCWTTIKGEAK